MEQHVTFAAQRTDCLDVLYHAGFVIDVHDRHQLRVFAQRIGQIADPQTTVFVRPQPGDLETALLQRAKYVGDGIVLGRHADEVLAAMFAVTCGTDDRKIVGFGCARCPNELLCAAIDQRGQLARRPLHDATRAPARNMNRGRIRKTTVHRHLLQHDLGNTRIDRCRRSVVEVNEIVAHDDLSRLRSTDVRMPRRMLSSFWSGRARIYKRRKRRIR